MLQFREINNFVEGDDLVPTSVSLANNLLFIEACKFSVQLGIAVNSWE
jgi:hypothetical protein